MCFPTVAGMIRNRSIRKICPRDSRARRPACVPLPPGPATGDVPGLPPGRGAAPALGARTRPGRGGHPEDGGAGAEPRGCGEGRGRELPSAQSLHLFRAGEAAAAAGRCLCLVALSAAVLEPQKIGQQRAQRVKPRRPSRLPAGPGLRRGNGPRPGREGRRGRGGRPQGSGAGVRTRKTPHGSSPASRGSVIFRLRGRDLSF